MPGLDKGLVEHKLPIKEEYLPVKQARKRMSMETELKVKEEIERLIKQRKTGAIRVCVDYWNLNEASPKDEYPMPMTDLLVDGAAQNQMLSFMDGSFSKYKTTQVEDEPQEVRLWGSSWHQRGMEIDKNKAKSIIKALSPQNKKELQSLLGKINFLRRFISNSAKKTQPFSSLLKLKQEHAFRWEEQH
ncbi:unnamed protein product [Prunus armeniaca]